MNENEVTISKSQLAFGNYVHYITIASCLIALFAPVLILLFPDANILNPNVIFGAIFDGSKSAQIWEAAGVTFQTGDFWGLFFKNIFTPDGFAYLGIVLGCSVTMWALIPAALIFFKEKQRLYGFISLFVMAVIFLALSGAINMAG